MHQAQQEEYFLSISEPYSFTDSSLAEHPFVDVRDTVYDYDQTFTRKLSKLLSIATHFSNDNDNDTSDCDCDHEKNESEKKVKKEKKRFNLDKNLPKEPSPIEKLDTLKSQLLHFQNSQQPNSNTSQTEDRKWAQFLSHTQKSQHFQSLYLQIEQSLERSSLATQSNQSSNDSQNNSVVSIVESESDRNTRETVEWYFPSSQTFIKSRKERPQVTNKTLPRTPQTSNQVDMPTTATPTVQQRTPVQNLFDTPTPLKRSKTLSPTRSRPKAFLLQNEDATELEKEIRKNERERAQFMIQTLRRSQSFHSHTKNSRYFFEGFRERHNHSTPPGMKSSPGSMTSLNGMKSPGSMKSSPGGMNSPPDMTSPGGMVGQEEWIEIHIKCFYMNEPITSQIAISKLLAPIHNSQSLIHELKEKIITKYRHLTPANTATTTSVNNVMNDLQFEYVDEDGDFLKIIYDEDFRPALRKNKMVLYLLPNSGITSSVFTE